MRLLAVVFAILAAATAAAAQDDARLRAAAERYVAGEGVQRSIEASLSSETIAAALDAQLGERLSPVERSEIAAVVAEEMTAIRPAMEEAMVEAAAATFTLSEIEAMTEFHETPEGAAILRKTPDFAAAYLGAMAPELRAATERAMARAAEAAGAP